MRDDSNNYVVEAEDEENKKEWKMIKMSKTYREFITVIFQVK